MRFFFIVVVIKWHKQYSTLNELYIRRCEELHFAASSLDEFIGYITIYFMFNLPFINCVVTLCSGEVTTNATLPE